MKKNMGSADRIIRITVALLVALFSFTGAIMGPTSIILGVLVVVFVLTSLEGTYPLYLRLWLSMKNN